MPKGLNNFISDVRSGFSNANSGLSHLGTPMMATPTSHGVISTPWGTAGIHTPTPAPLQPSNPALDFHMRHQAASPPPMAYTAAHMNPQDPEFLAHARLRGMPEMSYLTPSTMGVYRPGVQGSPVSAVMTPYSNGMINDYLYSRNPMVGVGLGSRGLPYGYDPLTVGGAAAGSLANRAFIGGTSAMRLTTGIAGGVGGGFVGGGIGSYIGGTLGGFMGSVGGPLGVYGGMTVGSAIGAHIGAGMGIGYGASLGYRANPAALLTDRREDMLSLRGITRGIVTSGDQLDLSGSGLSVTGASDMARGLRGLAAESASLTRADFNKIAGLAAESGLLNMANNSDKAVQDISRLSKSLKVFMGVMGDPDVQSAMSSMGELYRSGVAFNNLNEAASNIRTFARMAGVDVQTALNTSGAQGGFMFKQVGMSQGTGIQQGIASQGIANALVQTNAISAEELNRMGGVSGIGQAFAQSAAGFAGNGMNGILPGLLQAGGPNGVRINQERLQQFIRGNVSLQELMSDQSVFGGAGGFSRLQYVQNNTAQLKNDVFDAAGPAGQQAMIMQAIRGLQNSMPGVDTQSAAMMLTGDSTAALAYSSLMSNPDALGALQQQQLIGARQQGMLEYGQHMQENNVWERNVARRFRRLWSGMGNGLFGAMEGWGNRTEEQLLAESQGLLTRNNAGAGLRLSASDSGPINGGLYNQRQHWYSQGLRPADDIILRGMGYESATSGLAGLGEGIMRIFGQGTIMDDETVSAIASDFTESGKLLGGEISRRDIQRASRDSRFNRAMELFGDNARAAGRDNAGFTVGQYRRLLEKEFGSVDSRFVNQMYQVGMNSSRNDDEIRVAMDMTNITSGRLGGLGQGAGSVSSLNSTLRQGLRDSGLSGQGFMGGFGSAPSAIRELSRVLSSNGVSEEDTEEVATLLGRAQQGDTAASARLDAMGYSGVLDSLGDGGTVTALKRLNRLAGKNGMGVGDILGSVSGTTNMLARATLSDVLSARGFDMSAFNSAEGNSAQLNALRNLEGSGLTRSSTDEEVYAWANSILGGTGNRSVTGGVVSSRDPVQNATNASLSALQTSAETMYRSASDFAEAVERFEIAASRN